MAVATKQVSENGFSVGQVLDNQIRVATPENISFRYEATGPFRRVVGYGLDVLFSITVFAALAIVTSLALAYMIHFTAGTPLEVMLRVVRQAIGGAAIAVAFAWLWFYGAYMETNYNGQTFGKMIAKIRTISVNGSSIDASQAAIRNFFRLLDISPFISMTLLLGPEFSGFFPVPIFAFGFICMTLSPRYQRLGDLIAGTMVVAEDKKWVYGLAQFQDSRVAELATMIPDDFVVNSDLAKTLAEYVDRRREFPQQRKDEIAGHLASPMIRLFDLPASSNPDLVLCALYYKSFIDNSVDEAAHRATEENLLDRGKEIR